MIRERVEGMLSDAMIFDEFILTKGKEAEEAYKATKALKEVEGSQEDLKKLITRMKLAEVEYMTAIGQYGQMVYALREMYSLLRLSEEDALFEGDQKEFLDMLDKPTSEAYAIVDKAVKVVDENQHQQMVEKIEDALTDDEISRILGSPLFS